MQLPYNIWNVPKFTILDEYLLSENKEIKEVKPRNGQIMLDFCIICKQSVYM